MIHVAYNRALLSGAGCFGFTPTAGIAFDPAQTVGRLANGNRTILGTGLGFVNNYSRSLLPITEPIYLEIRVDAPNGSMYVGLARSDFTLSNVVGIGANSFGVSLVDGVLYYGGANVGSMSAFGTTGGVSILNFAFDPRYGEVYLGKDHAWLNDAIPGRRIRPSYTLDPTKSWYFAATLGIWTEEITINDAPEAPPSFYCNLHPGIASGLPQAWRLDASKKSTAIALTWGGRRAFQTSGSGAVRNALSVSPITGKKYLEVPLQCDAFGTMTNKAFGLATSAQGVDTRLGTDGTKSIAIFGNGQVERGGVLATQATYASTNAFGMCVDEPNRLVWFGKNGTFAVGDPAAGTGGYDISAITGDLYAAVGMDEASSFGDEAIIGNTSFTPPAGFTPV